MEDIYIQLKQPTPHGRLYPIYRPELELLALDSVIRRNWPYGIDIDGRIIFDVDANRVLGAVEILMRKSLWQVVPVLDMPPPSRVADLEIREESLQHKSFHLALTITTNESRTSVKVTFGDTEHTTDWIALSDRCFALVAGDHLKGFFVRLE